MSYKIKYEKEIIKTNISSRKQLSYERIRPVIIAAVVVSLLLLSGGKGIKNFLLPGDAEITENALNKFTEYIQTNSSISDALEVFCREIIDSDGVS